MHRETKFSTLLPQMRMGPRSGGRFSPNVCKFICLTCSKTGRLLAAKRLGLLWSIVAGLLLCWFCMSLPSNSTGIIPKQKPCNLMCPPLSLSSKTWCLRVGGLFPNIPPFVSEGDLQVLSWSARGVCLYNQHDRKKMLERGRSLFKSCHIMCLQEVHGSEGAIFHHFSRTLLRWKIFCSTPLSEDGSAVTSAGQSLLPTAQFCVRG